MTIFEKKILIVEDHPVFSEGLRSIINSKKGVPYRIVGEAVNAKDAWKLLTDFRPHLALVDITLSGPENGINLTKRIVKEFPDTQVLILSMHAKIDYVCEAIKAGAKGYLTKDSAAEELLDAMAVVLKQGSYLDPNLSPDIMDALKSTANGVSHFSDDSYSMLSPREQEVFRLLATGVKIVDIGKQLDVSPKTIDNHKANIFRKLHFTSYYDLYQYASRIGLINSDD